MNILKKMIGVLILTFFAGSALAETFVITKIQFEGLQRISRETALSYLPVKTGQTLDSLKTADVIRSLYGTGFFSNIRVAHEGGILRVHVDERPVIASIKFSGNHDIEKDKLSSVLKDLGLVEGRVFDNAVLEKIKKGLQSEYYGRGKYNATVTTTVTPQERNRVALNIDISEGSVAKVKRIAFIGNHAFSTHVLLKQLPLSTTNIFSFFTSDDQYSQTALSGSLEALVNYYLDHGYIRVKVEGTSVSITPDRKSVYITIHVNEGLPYVVKDIHLTGNLILPEEKIRRLITVKTGDLFSRKQVIATTKAIGHALGNKGYLFASVNTLPEKDDKTRQVSLTFLVEPNQRIHIRRITFSGNTRTSDISLRHELQQMEGAVASTHQIKESERRLRLLGYLQKVHAKVTPVGDNLDQADIDYQVSEAPSAGATLALGYGTNGVYVNAGVNQTNFLGTGKYVGANFERSSFAKVYSFSYNNPYYTVNGIQRGFSLFSKEYTPGDLNVTNYNFNSYGASVNYSFPINSKGDRLQASVGYQDTALMLGHNSSRELLDFVTDSGRCGADQCKTHFDQGVLTLGWSRNFLNRAIFPTSGINQVASLQAMGSVGGATLNYYKANYNFHWYQPIWRDFIFTTVGAFGYGGGIGETRTLPFFQNYFAGGIGVPGAVRGYGTNSIGPMDSNARPLGGNMLAAGSVGIIFPNFISPERLRTTAFIDAGNVYNTHLSPEPPYYSNQHAGHVRFSAGLGVEWRIPMLEGVFSFSVAKPLNPQQSRLSQPGLAAIPEDDKQVFQFTFGTSF